MPKIYGTLEWLTLQQRMYDNDTSLTALNLDSEEIKSYGANIIAAALKDNHTLTSLNLASNRIGPKGVIPLAAALNDNYTLTSFNIDNNEIRDDGANALATVLKVNHTLTSLSLGSTSIKDAGINALATALKNNDGLTLLKLDRNRFKADGTKALAMLLKNNSTLTWLDVECNEIRDDGAIALATALKDNDTLISLNLAHNGIRADGADALATTLKENRTLTSLNLEGNTMAIKGTKALAMALKDNYTLISLNLAANRIGKEGAIALLTVLKNNPTLTSLNIDYNEIKKELQQEIDELLKINKKLPDSSLSTGDILESKMNTAQFDIDKDANREVSSNTGEFTEINTTARNNEQRQKREFINLLLDKETDSQLQVDDETSGQTINAGDRPNIPKLINKKYSSKPSISSGEAKWTARKPLPDAFRCPITHEIMQDPVCAADGYAYERKAIMHWLQIEKKTHSPVLNLPLEHTSVCPNNFLKQQIDAFVKKHPQVLPTALIDICTSDNASQTQNEKEIAEEIDRALWLGAKLDAQDGQGSTALHWAVTYNDSVIVGILLTKGANPNSLDHQRQTPLHIACLKGHEGLVKALLHHQADPTLCNQANQTALNCVESENRALMRLLKEHMRLMEQQIQQKNTVKNAPPEVKWVSNLALCYQDFIIKADNHQHLRGQVHQAEILYQQKNANYVTMQLGFFYTDIMAKKKQQAPYHYFDTLAIGSQQQNFIHVSTEYPENESFLQDLERYHPTDKDKIRSYYQADVKINFYQLFHHSERGLFKHLETQKRLTQYVTEFASQLKTSRGMMPQEFRIKIAVLDMHSSHYLCKWCEPALQYFQKPDSPFSQQLQAELKSVEFTISNNFYITSRYSAEKPAAQQSIKSKKDHSPQHQIIDIKAYKKNKIPLIVQRDDQQTMGVYKDDVALATSRKPKHLNQPKQAGNLSKFSMLAVPKKIPNVKNNTRDNIDEAKEPLSKKAKLNNELSL